MRTAIFQLLGALIGLSGGLLVVTMDELGRDIFKWHRRAAVVVLVVALGTIAWMVT